MKSSHTWIIPLARAGYAARGLVYLIIGIFTVLASFGAGDEKDSKDALRTLLEQPLGDFMVGLMIIGLGGYVVWRLIQSLLDTDDHGWSAKGLVVRAGLLASAFTYAALALYALSLLGLVWGSGSSGSSGGFAESLSRFVSTQYISLGLAIIFFGVAAAHWRKAALRKYEDHLKATEAQMTYIHPISIAGLIARGLDFALLGVLLTYRFLNAGEDASKAPTTEDALEFLQGLPFGQWLLLAMGVGLILFAAYSFTEAIWRNINVEDASVKEQV
uniref:DUF1206 domain-containing protein n=1 Tax=Pararhizobium sp. IMCC3301 TaxID=3067904 RepID=UPI002741E5F9|nr:DUF1206 domain-containing protein [Pararhizobium sp. IMCC3301]